MTAHALMIDPVRDLISSIAAECSGNEEQVADFLAALQSVTGLTIEELTQHIRDEGKTTP
jgi:hypothetical protein